MRKVSAVIDFLTAEPNGTKPFVAKVSKRSRRKFACKPLQFLVYRPSRSEGHLLLEDESQQRREAGLARPQRRHTVPLGKLREHRVHFGKRGRGGSKRCFAQRRDNDPPLRRVVIDGALPVGAGQSRFSLIRVALPTRSRR